jgi:hypothetical protein
MRRTSLTMLTVVLLCVLARAGTLTTSDGLSQPQCRVWQLFVQSTAELNVFTS